MSASYIDVMPHDAARAEIEAAVAEDAPDNVVDPASAQEELENCVEQFSLPKSSIRKWRVR